MIVVTTNVELKSPPRDVRGSVKFAPCSRDHAPICKRRVGTTFSQSVNCDPYLVQAILREMDNIQIETRSFARCGKLHFAGDSLERDLTTLDQMKVIPLVSRTLPV